MARCEYWLQFRLSLIPVLGRMLVNVSEVEGGVVIRLQLLLAMFFPAAFSVLPIAGAAGPLALATALTASVALILLVSAVHVHLDPAAAPARIRTIALRERARQSAFLRLRDPDASGRARPRAPSARSAAA